MSLFQVGAGRKHFDKARSMLKSWQHMDLGEAWILHIHPGCRCLHAPFQRPNLELRAPSGWVQTNQPAISKGQKVCIAARSLFLWSCLPLEVVYARNERTRLPRQLRGFSVNRRLTAADTTASTQSATGAQRNRP